MKDVLKKKFRDLLISDYSLRVKIGIDIVAHERTIQRWAEGGTSRKLLSKHFLESFRKHAGIDKSEDLTEEVELLIESK